MANIQLVLQEKVANLGGVGDRVIVKPGYARNYLIPRGKAVPATEAHLKAFEARRAELEARASHVLADAEKRLAKFADVVLTILARASEEGKLFGSVGPREIAEAAVAAGHALHKSEVSMPVGLIRMTGEHEVTLQLHSDVNTTLKIVVERDRT